MGCDIHLYVEYKQEIKKEFKWVSGDYFKHDPYYDPSDENFSLHDKFEKIGLYEGRNYSLFSTLAGVRDYSGEIRPVSEPKGLPDDCCEYVRLEFDRWDSDGHTHSWLTLKELIDYQKTKPVLYYSGLLAPDDFKALDEKGIFPQSWCQETSNSSFEKRTWSEPNNTLKPLIELLQQRAKELLFYPWEKYNKSREKDIRIVFWFDN